MPGLSQSAPDGAPKLETYNYWRTYVPRMDADKADARDRAQAIINLELRRYSRRLKAAAEETIDEMFADAQLTETEFDYRAAAVAGLKSASSLYSLELGA